MIYTVKHSDNTYGVANYPDEAREFAVRFSGNGHRPVGWSSSGELLVNGVPTGWKVSRGWA